MFKVEDLGAYWSIFIYSRFCLHQQDLAKIPSSFLQVCAFVHVCVCGVCMDLCVVLCEVFVVCGKLHVWAACM